jgi:hypothetical protein
VIVFGVFVAPDLRDGIEIDARCGGSGHIKIDLECTVVLDHELGVPQNQAEVGFYYGGDSDAHLPIRAYAGDHSSANCHQGAGRHRTDCGE